MVVAVFIGVGVFSVVTVLLILAIAKWRANSEQRREEAVRRERRDSSRDH